MFYGCQILHEVTTSDKGTRDTRYTPLEYTFTGTRDTPLGYTFTCTRDTPIENTFTGKRDAIVLHTNFFLSYINVIMGENVIVTSHYRCC